MIEKFNRKIEKFNPVLRPRGRRQDPRVGGRGPLLAWPVHRAPRSIPTGEDHLRRGWPHPKMRARGLVNNSQTACSERANA